MKDLLHQERLLGQVHAHLGEDTENPGPALWDNMMRDGTWELLQVDNSI